MFGDPEQHLGKSEEIPTFAKFLEFLEIRHRTLEALQFTANSISVNYVDSNSSNASAQPKFNQNKFNNTTKANSKNETRINHASTERTVVACSLCKDPHILRRCTDFFKLDCYERNAFVDRSKHCRNCLSSTHLLAACPSTRNCHVCGKRHHTLLHIPNNNVNPSSPAVSKPNKASAATTSVKHTASTPLPALLPILANSAKFLSKTQVLLPTAIVQVFAPDGSKFLLRTLIDEGSTGALISERATQALSLKRWSINSAIKYPDGQRSSVKAVANFTIQSRFNNHTPIDLCASVVLSVTEDLPSRSIQYHDWPHLRGLELADPEFYRSAPIDLLIGSDVKGEIVMPELRKGQSNEPVAQRTLFGWIVLGRGMDVSPTATVEESSTVCAHANVEDLDTLVKQFYAIETVPAECEHTPEERWCQEFFERTTTRQPNGKYLVRLPFKTSFDPNMTIGKSKQMALNRFHSLERKLASNPELKEQYVNAISEYFTDLTV